MKILVIGCGKLGVKVLKQLAKNNKMEIVTADINEEPEAVKKGLIKKVDIVENVTSVNIINIAKEHKPDLVFLARTADDWGHEDTMMASQLVARMEEELNILHIPIIPVAHHIEF